MQEGRCNLLLREYKESVETRNSEKLRDRAGREGERTLTKRRKGRAGREERKQARYRRDSEKNKKNAARRGETGGTESEDVAKPVRSRQWSLVHLHLNRVAWRYLTLKMVSVYYPLETPPSYLSSCTSSFVAYSISSEALKQPLNSPSAAPVHRRASECIVYAAIRETYCRLANNERFPRGRSVVFIFSGNWKLYERYSRGVTFPAS